MRDKYERREKHKRRSPSRSRSRSKEKKPKKEQNNQIVIYKERTSPSRFITEELGNELTNFSLRSTIRDKLDRAKNEERKKEKEKFKFNFQKKENNNDHLDTFMKQKMIEAIEDENPHSLEAIAQYHKHSKDTHHLNAMFSNDFALEKKLKLKEKEKQTKSNETKTGFEIKDDDLLNTFG